MTNLLKIGIPIVIVLLMLLVIGTGILLAKEQSTAVSAGPVVSAGYPNGTWAGCWYNGSYCPGPCGRGGWYGGNSGTNSPSGTNAPSADLPPCCRGY